MPRTLTVGDLLEILEGEDPNTKVTFMYQKSWPLESAVSHVVKRYDVDDDAGDEEGEELVFVEGEQIGYGSKKAWY